MGSGGRIVLAETFLLSHTVSTTSKLRNAVLISSH